MSVDISGRTNQRWVSRDALQRFVTRYAIEVSAVCLGLLFFSLGVNGYLAYRPYEIPYVLHEGTNGDIEPAVQTVVADDAAKRFLVTTWIGAWRLGCNDPRSLCAQQTSALVSGANGDPVRAQVKAYNQSILDNGWTVTPAITSIDAGSLPDQYLVRWVERAANKTGTSVTHIMSAYVTLAESPSSISLHSAIVNPFGEYIRDLRVVEETTK